MDKIKLTSYKNHADLQLHDNMVFSSLSPKERLNQVELLRLEAGKFLYEYPARLRRVITVDRRAER